MSIEPAVGHQRGRSAIQTVFRLVAAGFAERCVFYFPALVHGSVLEINSGTFFGGRSLPFPSGELQGHGRQAVTSTNRHNYRGARFSMESYRRKYTRLID